MAEDPQEKEVRLRADLERLNAEYGEDFVKRVLKQFRKKKGPKGPRGRRLLEDAVALATMADLLHLKSATSERQAAFAVADNVEGHSLDAKVHRLCRKFREQRGLLKAEAVKRHKPRIRFAVEKLVGRPVEEIRREAAAGPVPGSARIVSDLRREAILRGTYNSFSSRVIEEELARSAAALRLGYAGSLDEIKRSIAQANAGYEEFRQRYAEQIRQDQERFRQIALGLTWGLGQK